MSRIVTLTTDFGPSGTYVAAMKGVILGINPAVTIVDVTQTIAPQNILQAALAIDSVYDYFPERTVHVVVIDPGVGTERRAMILRTPQADFVTPDNGVLSYIVRRYSAQPWGDSAQPFEIDVPEGLEAVHMTRPEFWRQPVSSTFHGRDIFAPVAARLSLGIRPQDFGEKLSRLIVLPLPYPEVSDTGLVTGHVIDIDSFGNLITDITADDLSSEISRATVTIGDVVISGLVRTYAEGEDLVALFGSSGRLEIALKNGSAQSRLNATVGDRVAVELP